MWPNLYASQLGHVKVYIFIRICEYIKSAYAKEKRKRVVKYAAGFYGPQLGNNFKLRPVQFRQQFMPEARIWPILSPNREHIKCTAF